MNLLSREHPTGTFLPHEKFFLELWHGMTHEASLDSHRVRCLNARTIIRELDQELRIGRAKPDEIQDLCAEADEILTRDLLAASSFARHLGLLQPLLKTPPIPDDKKKEKDAAAELKLREFRFIIADFSAALERDYFKQLLAILPDTIVAGDGQKTEAVGGALLSDLVDQGWPLETLFSWVGLFFQKKQPPYDTFAGNLRFLIQQLSWSKQKYRVILRLSGSSKLSGFGGFAGFNFRALPGFTPDSGAQQRKFAITSSLTTFAETPVEAVDLTAAAITAREKFEQCLDQLRFNFEPEPLKVALRDLEYPGALKLLQAQPMATKLANSFPNNPVAAVRIDRLAAILQDPKKTADALVLHQKHLLWQLGRLYRIRCCIVHGSAVRFKLPLLTANMEFYLKELIIVCLRSLTLNPHVVSLREVFQRAAFVRQRLDAELRAPSPNPDTIRNAVFNSVVIQENL